MGSSLFNAIAGTVTAFLSFIAAGGIIRILVVVILALAVLTYFGFDLQSFVQSEGFQNNFGFVWDMSTVAFNFLKDIWNTYLSAPAFYFWNNVFVGLLWNSFIDNLTRIREGKPHDFQLNAPYVPVQYNNQ